MVEDIAYNEDIETNYDEVGDIKTVNGSEAIQQAVATAIIENVGPQAPSLDPTSLEERRSEIQDAVAAVSFTEQPISVSIEFVDAGSDRTDPTEVIYLVETNRISLALPAS